MTEPDTNLTAPAQAAAEIQKPTTEAWADDLALDRCVSTHQMSTPTGEVMVRCDGSAGHAGDQHESHVNDEIIHWAAR